MNPDKEKTLGGKPNPNVVYCLTRGYKGFRKLYYVLLVVRNLGVLIFLKRTHQMSSTDVLVMHEGNISSNERRILNAFAFGKLQFVDVSADFEKLPIHEWTESNTNLGYSLMCRFQYSRVWNYIQKYEKALRVDEDVVLITGPILEEVGALKCGFLEAESHLPTNETLPGELAKIGFPSFYDHQFPYSNVMAISLDFWMTPKVQKALLMLGDNPLSLSMRWGDLPILGVVARSFSGLDSESLLDRRISYVHLSHLSVVRQGVLTPLSALQGFVNTTSRLRRAMRSMGKTKKI